MAGPLAGKRVLDVTQAVAGPVAGVMLADLGADVIHVEYAAGLRPLSAGGALPLRPGSPDEPYNRGLLFNEYNRGKQSISLNLASAEGRQLFLRLVELSDIVVDNNSPRVFVNLGIDYANLVRYRTDIIVVSISAFGLSGPYRDRMAYGPGVDAMSGMSYLTGYADSQPLKPGNFYCDQSSAAFAVLATLAAVWQRDRTGQGQLIDTPMIEGAFLMLGDAYLDLAMNGRNRSRAGNRHGWAAPHGVYPCAGDDRWIAIAVEADAQWQALCLVMGGTDLGEDARYRSSVQRYRHQDEIDAVIRAWTSTRDHYALQQELQAAGVPAGAVLDGIDLLADPHAIARGTFVYADAPGVGPSPYARSPFLPLCTGAPYVPSAPAYGEHNEDVYGGLLGLPAHMLTRLEAGRVIQRTPAPPG